MNDPNDRPQEGHSPNEQWFGEDEECVYMKKKKPFTIKQSHDDMQYAEAYKKKKNIRKTP